MLLSIIIERRQRVLSRQRFYIVLLFGMGIGALFFLLAGYWVFAVREAKPD